MALSFSIRNTFSAPAGSAFSISEATSSESDVFPVASFSAAIKSSIKNAVWPVQACAGAACRITAAANTANIFIVFLLAVRADLFHKNTLSSWSRQGRNIPFYSKSVIILMCITEKEFFAVSGCARPEKHKGCQPSHPPVPFS